MTRYRITVGPRRITTTDTHVAASCSRAGATVTAVTEGDDD